jgi:hypothetical protein
MQFNENNFFIQIPDIIVINEYLQLLIFRHIELLFLLFYL